MEDVHEEPTGQWRIIYSERINGSLKVERISHVYEATDAFDAMDKHDERVGSGGSVVWSCKEVH